MFGLFKSKAQKELENHQQIYKNASNVVFGKVKEVLNAEQVSISETVKLIDEDLSLVFGMTLDLAKRSEGNPTNMLKFIFDAARDIMVRFENEDIIKSSLTCMAAVHHVATELNNLELYQHTNEFMKVMMDAANQVEEQQQENTSQYSGMGFRASYMK